MFEKAARLKLRFSYKGQISVEDLWDLGVEELDAIYKSLNSRYKAAKEDSLLATKSSADEATELGIAIVKHVVEVKLAEALEKKNLKAKLAEKQKLMGILAVKEDAALQNLSAEELRAKIDALG